MKKLLTRKWLIAGIVVGGFALTILVGVAGYVIWGIGTYIVSVLANPTVPMNVGQMLQSCSTSLFNVFALETWMAQPLAETWGQLKGACLSFSDAVLPKGESL